MHKSYFALDTAKWTRNEYCVCVVGKDKRRVSMRHLADSLSLTPDALSTLCYNLELDVSADAGNAHGWLLLTDVPKLLAHLKWTDDEIDEGMACLDVERGRSKPFGPIRPRYDVSRKNEDESSSNSSSVKKRDRKEQEEEEQEDWEQQVVAELDSYLGPEAIEAFQRTDAFEDTKKALVHETMLEYENVIAERVRARMRNTVRAEIKELLTPSVRARLADDPRWGIRLQQQEAVRVYAHNPPPTVARKEKEYMDALISALK